MKNIHLVSLESNAHLVQPEEFNEISLDSSVRNIFTDFKKHRPLVIEADTLACDALYLMQKAHVHLQLVVDKNNELIGTISQNELNEQQFLIEHKRGLDRYQLTVNDLMLERENIKGLHDAHERELCDWNDTVGQRDVQQHQADLILVADEHQLCLASGGGQIDLETRPRQHGLRQSQNRGLVINDEYFRRFRH